MLDELKRFIGKEYLFEPNETVLLTVSGGIDSMVMADLFYRAKFRFAIAHCNFSLRGKDSDDDEQFVRQFASGMGVPFYCRRFDTGLVASRSGISIQMAARQLRYGWFEEIRAKNGFDYIATAHHLDDQVETFLINLIRGTGIAGLHGIPVKNGKIIRPMLFAGRQEIAAYAREEQVAFREDKSNQETKYTRNKIRHEVIPLLCSINPGFNEGLAETISRLRAFEQIGMGVIGNWKAKAVHASGGDLILDPEHLRKSPHAGMLAWEFLSRFGFNETQLRNLIDSLGSESRKVFLSPTHRMIKERGRLVVSPLKPAGADKAYKIRQFARKKRMTVPLCLDFEVIPDATGYEIPATGDIASLDADKLDFPLTLRRRKPGDSFCPLGMRKKKKVSDFLINQKVSLADKEQTWLLCSGTDIAWIIGQRIDHRFRITPSTRRIIRITKILK